MHRSVACLFFSLPGLHALAADISAAERALQQGRSDEAIRLLTPIVSAQPSNAAAHQLLCRVYYAEESIDASVKECELAANSDPNSSDNQMWLGKAYGLKASNASLFAALGLAKKVRVSFEQAVQLDATNIPAATALGEYYIAAPSIVGGGLDKAQRVATQIEQTAPASSHRLLGMMAEKQKDMDKAETEFRHAVEAGGKPAAWADLGAFYQRQGQLDKAVTALQSAVDADHAHDAALMDVASILDDAHRSPELAEKVLRLYLASSAKSEAAPAFKVHVQLGQLLAQRGDKDGARREYTAALALASSYSPARKALQGL